jgi:hypothetical protein
MPPPTHLFGIPAREPLRAARLRRSSSLSRPPGRKPMAQPLRRRSTRPAATSRLSPKRPISALSHLPAEFSCEILAREFPSARLLRSRWINFSVAQASACGLDNRNIKTHRLKPVPLDTRFSPAKEKADPRQARLPKAAGDPGTLPIPA